MPDHPSYYDQIKGVVGDVQAASEDGKFTTREIMDIAVGVIDVGLHIQDFIDDPNSHVEELIRDCERLFDDLVPADLPMVPDYLEGVVKMIARQSIRPTIVAAVDKLQAA